MKVPTALYDANVLYPAPLRDILVRLAMEGLVRARWTHAIHEEWTRNLLRNRPDLAEDQLLRTRELMDRAVRDSVVTGYEKHISDLTLPDPGDRHVLAAAIHSRADIILTLNTRDFPKSALDPHRIVSRDPDAFVASLIDGQVERVCGVVRAQRSALLSPPLTVEEFLDALRVVGMSKTVRKLEVRREEL